jgi:outer membrane protein OmpA-like peptidoglycan-associated protein
MHKANRLLLAGVAIALVGGPQAFAAPQAAPPIVLAQAANQVPEAVAAAEAKVQAARDALQQAMADGKGIKEARKALRAALKALNEARVATGLPPVNEPAPAAEAPPPADQSQPPATAETPPPADLTQPPAVEAKAPPTEAPAPAADALKRKRKPPTDEVKAPPAPPEAPAEQAKAPPPAPTMAPAEQAKSEAPANPPPPVMVDGKAPKFDPSLLKKPHPRFGETPKGDTNLPLPKQEAQIPTGGEINAGAGRTIVKEADGQVTVRHDDTDRFRRLGGNVDVQQGRDGTTTTVVNRPGGVQVVTVKDRDGNILQRYRKDARGQIEVLIGQAGPQQNGRNPPPPPKAPAPNASFDIHIQLPPLKLTIPRDQYVVESSRASRRELTQAFEAPPVEKVERAYTLEEIRRSDRIRDKVRRVDFDTVTFEFGSAVLPDDQIPQMQAVGEAMQAVLKQDPDQVFLIEGHTDAVGSDLANLALSDRRAETVAEILTYYFGVPPENLVTQGYGEEFLKVPTTAPERENRRVAFRNITALMRTSGR